GAGADSRGGGGAPVVPSAGSGDPRPCDRVPCQRRGSTAWFPSGAGPAASVAAAILAGCPPRYALLRGISDPAVLRLDDRQADRAWRGPPAGHRTGVGRVA